MKALVISGSPRKEESLTGVLAEVIQWQLEELEIESELWLLSEKSLPLADPAYHKDPLSNEHPEVVRSFAKAIDDAETVVLVTPVYNGSYSAHLKNALDSLRWDHFRGKSILLSSQGNPASAGIACGHLNEVARTLQGNVLNSYLVVDRKVIDLDSRSISDTAVLERIKTILG